MKKLFRTFRDGIQKLFTKKIYIENVQKEFEKAFEANDKERIRYLLTSPEIANHPYPLWDIKKTEVMIHEDPDFVIFLFEHLEKDHKEIYLDFLLFQTLYLNKIELFKFFANRASNDLLKKQPLHMQYLIAYCTNRLNLVSIDVETADKEELIQLLEKAFHMKDRALIDYCENLFPELIQEKDVRLYNEISICNSTELLDMLLKNNDKKLYNIQKMLQVLVIRENVKLFQHLIPPKNLWSIEIEDEDQFVNSKINKVLLLELAGMTGSLNIVHYMDKKLSWLDNSSILQKGLASAACSDSLETFQYLYDDYLNKFSNKGAARSLMCNMIDTIFEKSFYNSVDILNYIVGIYDLEDYVIRELDKYLLQSTNKKDLTFEQNFLKSKWVQNVNFYAFEGAFLKNLCERKDVETLKGLLSTAPRLDGVQEVITSHLVSSGDVELFTELSPFFAEVPPVEETPLFI